MSSQTIRVFQRAVIDLLDVLDPHDKMWSDYALHATGCYYGFVERVEPSYHHKFSLSLVKEDRMEDFLSWYLEMTESYSIIIILDHLDPKASQLLERLSTYSVTVVSPAELDIPKLTVEADIDLEFVCSLIVSSYDS